MRKKRVSPKIRCEHIVTTHGDTDWHVNTHTQSQAQGCTAESVNNWWWCGCLVDAKAPGQQNFSLSSSQTGLPGCFCMCDTSSHVKRTGCLPHTVVRRQRIRARIWKKCELIIISDWFGLEQTWDCLLFDWLGLRSVEKSTPSLSFNSCGARGMLVCVCMCVCVYSTHLHLCVCKTCSYKMHGQLF